jgi:hypothetical protein
VRHITPPSTPFYMDKTRNFWFEGATAVRIYKIVRPTQSSNMHERSAACTARVKFVVLDGREGGGAELRLDGIS